MPMIEVKNLNLGFNCEEGFCQALYDVSFSLEKGQIHSLVGESGCGKTISAMSILGLLPKTAKIAGGEILYNNENLLLKKDIQKYRGAKIALIPQDPMTSLNPLYTIGNQLLEVIKIHQNLRGDKAYKKAVEALDAVQIPCAAERMKSYPHEFSGGMKQRAIIAMALACNAEILIADEPTTALDVTIQAQIMKLLSDIKLNNKTAILFITHDLALVSENADKISVMYAGRIVETAKKEDLFKKELAKIQKEHSKARHVVYAYRIDQKTKSCDDREPKGTAGRPLLELLLKKDLNKVALVVVRYFGGSLLGAGRLLRTYVQSGVAVLKAAGIE